MNSSDSNYNIVLTVSLVIVAILSGLYYLRSHEIRQLQGLQAAATQVQAQRQVLSSLISEMMEYSKKDAGIDPLLISIGAKQGKAPAVAPATNSKPATK